MFFSPISQNSCQKVRRAALVAGLLFCVLLLPCTAGSALGQARLTADELLELMRANDAQFDNILVEYLCVSYEDNEHNSPLQGEEFEAVLRIDPDVDRSGLPSDVELLEMASKYVPDGVSEHQPPEEARKWVDLIRRGKIRFILKGKERTDAKYVKTSNRNEMALRWPDIAVLQQSGSNSFNKFGSIDQNVHHLYSRTGSSREWFHMTQLKPRIPNVFQEHAIWLKFCLGIGYASLIEKVVSMTPSDDGYELGVKLRIWPHQLASGTLHVDRSFLVRRAKIDAGISQISVENEGLFADDQRFVCAESGSFGRLSPRERVIEKFDAQLINLRWDLDDADFNRIADMSPPSGEPLYEVRDGRAQLVRPVFIGGRFRWFLAANVLLVVVLIVFLIVKRRAGAT